MKLYGFDGIDDALELLPIAARRALDQAGLHLSREAWQALSLEVRKKVVDLGSAFRVDVAAVRELASTASPPPTRVEAVEEPAPGAPPPGLLAALGSRPLPDAVWSALSPLGRYALVKVASRGRQERLDAAYTEIVGSSVVSTHLGADGAVRMVSVTEKAVTARSASSETTVAMSAEAFERLKSHTVPKGDVLATARLAGIMAAKRTPDIVPLCHPLSISRVEIELSLDEAERAVKIVASVDAVDRTGVEMESLVAASAAALTVYDMLKGIDRGMTIGPTRLLSKTGGRSGEYRR